MDYKLPNRIENSNKSTYGKVLNIAGSDYMPGAAYLSSVSALKIGCGYCFLSSCERVIDIVASKTSNVVFVPLSEIPNHMCNSDVVEIGCGLSQDEFAVDIFKKVISEISQDKKLLIDADGLNILAKNRDLFINRNFKNVILTPHPKEASRLLDRGLDEVLNNIESSAFEISKKYNCVTALKTHNTVVVSPNGQKYVNNTGNNSMAKAGSGDVLAGMISGLLSQGMDLFEGACLGVYLHGMCGDIAKNELTEYSVMAEDLISYIPYAVKNYLKLK